MKAQISREMNESPLNTYRQSVSILSSELIRNSFSGEGSVPNIFRESVSSPYRCRNSLNIEMAERLLRGVEFEKREREKQQFTNLKSTLSDL